MLGTAGVGGRRAAGLGALPARMMMLVVLLSLAVPIFAHGCHGDDVDHEPGGAPPTPRSHSEARP